LVGSGKGAGGTVTKLQGPKKKNATSKKGKKFWGPRKKRVGGKAGERRRSQAKAESKSEKRPTRGDRRLIKGNPVRR